MGVTRKPRKKRNREEETRQVTSEQQPVAAAPVGLVKRKNRVIQEYEDFVTPPNTSSAEQPRGDDLGFHAEPEEPEEPERDELAEPEEPVDPIDALLQDIEDDSASSGFIIQVFRLPNYRTDGRVVGSMREFCGDLPATLDYLSLIRDYYDDGAGSTYHCTLKNSSRQIVRKWTVALARTRQQPAQAAPANPAAALPAHVTQQQPADPIGEVLKVAERYKQLREAFFPGEALHVQPRVQAEPPIERSLEDRIFDKLLDRADGDALDRLVDKYVGGGRSDGWMDIIAGAVKPYVPQILALISRAQGGAPGQSPIAIEAQTSDDTGDDDPMQIIDDVLIPLLEETVRTRQIEEQSLERAASSIRQFAARNPVNAGYVAMLKQVTPDTVIGLLIASYPELTDRATRDPIVKEAIARLQQKLNASAETQV